MKITKKQFELGILISEYENAIEFAKTSTSYYDLLAYLRNNQLCLGVCSYLDNIYSATSLIKRDWIKLHTKGTFWYIIPLYCSNKEYVVDSLKYRLKILKLESKYE